MLLKGLDGALEVVVIACQARRGAGSQQLAARGKSLVKDGDCWIRCARLERPWRDFRPRCSLLLQSQLTQHALQCSVFGMLWLQTCNPLLQATIRELIQRPGELG